MGGCELKKKKTSKALKTMASTCQVLNKYKFKTKQSVKDDIQVADLNNLLFTEIENTEENRIRRKRKRLSSVRGMLNLSYL